MDRKSKNMATKKERERERNAKLGVAKFDTTREPDTTRHEISRLWVEA